MRRVLFRRISANLACVCFKGYLKERLNITKQTKQDQGLRGVQQNLLSVDEETRDRYFSITSTIAHQRLQQYDHI